MSAPFHLSAAMREIEDQYRHELRLQACCDGCDTVATMRVTIRTGGRVGDLVLLMCGAHYAKSRVQLRVGLDLGLG